MDPALTRLDFTADDRNRMRRVLDLLTEEGTVDELGLGTLRDALSEALFPDTHQEQQPTRDHERSPPDLLKRRAAVKDVIGQEHGHGPGYENREG